MLSSLITFTKPIHWSLDSITTNTTKKTDQKRHKALCLFTNFIFVLKLNNFLYFQLPIQIQAIILPIFKVYEI